MYLKIKRFKDQEGEKNGIKFIEHHISHLGLYSDDDDLIKRIKQDDVICKKMLETKHQVDLPDVMHLLNERDIKLIQDLQIKKLSKGVNLFDNIG